MMRYMFHVPANAIVDNMCAGRELEEKMYGQKATR